MKKKLKLKKKKKKKENNTIQKKFRMNIIIKYVHLEQFTWTRHKASRS